MTFFQLREHEGRLHQVLRESNWFMDSYYYQTQGQGFALNNYEQQIGQPTSPEIYFGNVTGKYTMQNNITTFANMEIADDIHLFEENTKQTFFPFVREFLQENQDQRLIETNYIEKIYPQEVNTFTALARARTEFDYWPWKSSKEARKIFLNTTT